MEIKFQKLYEDVQLPTYAHEGDSGADVYAYLFHLGKGPILFIPSGEIVKVPLGFRMEIPYGTEAQLRSRSSFGSEGIIIPNGIGTIDSTYRGEVAVMLMNLNHHTVEINHGDRIAQMVIAPVIHARFIEEDTLNKSARGSGGFGSTGRS